MTNVFGERLWVEPSGERRPAGNAGALFALAAHGAATRRARLVLLPAAPKVQEGRRWRRSPGSRRDGEHGLGHRAAGPVAAGRPRRERGRRQYRDHLQRLVPAPAGPPPEPAAPIRYQVMTRCRSTGSRSSRCMSRAACARPAAAGGVAAIARGGASRPEKVRPRTTMLRHGLPPLLRPRGGGAARRRGVTQSYQRTRWVGGRVAVWFGARKQTGAARDTAGCASTR